MHHEVRGKLARYIQSVLKLRNGHAEILGQNDECSAGECWGNPVESAEVGSYIRRSQKKSKQLQAGVPVDQAVVLIVALLRPRLQQLIRSMTTKLQSSAGPIERVTLCRDMGLFTESRSGPWGTGKRAGKHVGKTGSEGASRQP